MGSVLQPLLDDLYLVALAGDADDVEEEDGKEEDGKGEEEEERNRSIILASVSVDSPAPAAGSKKGKANGNGNGNGSTADAKKGKGQGKEGRSKRIAQLRGALLQALFDEASKQSAAPGCRTKLYDLHVRERDRQEELLEEEEE